MIDKNMLIMYASMCPEFDGTTRGIGQITALADKYCEALDEYDAATDDDARADAEDKKNCYISALMLKFWDQINNMYQKTKTADHFDYDDFYIKLYERINYACKYRAWQKPEAKTNAQQCIQMALTTEIKNIFYFANLDKNKVAAPANHMSIDTEIEGNDNGDTWADVLPDEVDSMQKIADDMTNDAIVQYYIDQKKPVQAIIIDVIASGDCEKEVKETVKGIDDETGEAYHYTKVRKEFWPYRLVHNLGSLPEDYESYFMNRYHVEPGELHAAIEAVRKANNQKLYRYWDKTKSDLKLHLDHNGCLVR